MQFTTFAVGTLCVSLVAAGCSTSRDRDSDSTGPAASSTMVPPTDSSAMAPGAQTVAVVVRTASDEKNGRYLVDGSGRALYMFEKDERGESYCDSACAAAWPPFLAQGAPTAGDSSVKAGMLSTIQRKDGSRQAAYNGMPLYHYAKDTGPGSTAGQDVKEFGAEWYLVSPDGKKQEGKEH